MKALLIGISIQDDSFPLSLASIKAWVEKTTDVSVDYRDFAFGNRFSQATNRTLEQKVVSYILLKNPDVVGFSAYIWNIKAVRAVAGILKSLRPGMRLVVGGPEADEYALDVFDFVVVREGELAFAELLSCLAGHRALADVRNLIFREGDRVVKTTEAVLERLDDLPFPYRSAAKKNHVSVKLETTRGCPFPCAYCHYSRVPLRHFSLDYLGEHLPWLFREFTFRNLTLLDANFNLDKKRMKAVLDLIQEQVRGELRVSFELKPDLIDEEVIAIMQNRPYLITAELGLQSTDAAVLGASRRPADLEAVARGVSLLDASGIRYKIDLMYGLPGDTFWKFLKSVAFVRKYAKRQGSIVAHHHMGLNPSFEKRGDLVRADSRESSMVVKTDTQDILDLYKTRLFLNAMNARFKKRGRGPNGASPS